MLCGSDHHYKCLCCCSHVNVFVWADHQVSLHRSKETAKRKGGGGMWSSRALRELSSHVCARVSVHQRRHVFLCMAMCWENSHGSCSVPRTGPFKSSSWGVGGRMERAGGGRGGRGRQAASSLMNAADIKTTPKHKLKSESSSVLQQMFQTCVQIVCCNLLSLPFVPGGDISPPAFRVPSPSQHQCFLPEQSNPNPPGFAKRGQVKTSD